MKIVSDKNNIIFLKGDSQYELTSTFLRMQEYYESPKFAGKHFDLEEYMDWYAEEYGNFTYTSDWNGFNVPGNVVRKFFETFKDDLLDKEFKLFYMLEPYLIGHKKFYVIGAHGESTTTRDVMRHEFSHAFYYLNKEYKKEQDALISKLPTNFKDIVFKWLKDNGYNQNVFEDEAVAYLSTNSMIETAEDFTRDASWEIILYLQENFDKVYKKYKEENKNE